MHKVTPGMKRYLRLCRDYPHMDDKLRRNILRLPRKKFEDIVRSARESELITDHSTEWTSRVRGETRILRWVSVTEKGYTLTGLKPRSQFFLNSKPYRVMEYEYQEQEEFEAILNDLDLNGWSFARCVWFLILEQFRSRTNDETPAPQPAPE